ncbi:putative glutamate carboxypeptidase LAMP1 [Capsicum chacoense]
MIKLPIFTFIILTTLISFLVLITTPPKSYYHSLFISNSFSDNSSVANHLYTLTKRPHVAGLQANVDAATYVLSIFMSCNLLSHVTYYVFVLTYPVYRSLVLTTSSNLEKTIVFDLVQEVYDGDPYVEVAHELLPTFHAYARSGTAVGPMVYANYGRVEDYTTLREMGVNVSNTVVLARYGKIFRGDIVHNAYSAGAIGVLIFTDKKDYGGERWFPNDKWMPLSGVQVGSVYDGIGDPTTPGWPSTGECERLSDEEVENEGNVPLIPSLPISWADGDAIIGTIGGKVANMDWQGGEDSPIYRVGPGPAIANLSYEVSIYEKKTKVFKSKCLCHSREDVSRFVILGNHRDAWTFGAVDPNSGTVTLLEIAQRLEKLQKRRWKPRRTIVLCNWDMEEYGLIGSAEWVEENRENAICKGRRLLEPARQVQDPDNSSQTIYQSWLASNNDTTIGRLEGAGSDYAAFVQHIVTPALDMSFGNGYLVYHLMYDDFVWMKKFGDPMFHRHAAVASIWGLVALRLADDEV